MTPSDGIGEDELLRLAAALERGSEHPLATAIVKKAEARGTRLEAAEGFESVTGKGVKGRVAGRAVGLGNLALLAELGVDPGPLAARAEQLRADGQTVMFVAVDGKAAGLVGVADPIKESTPEAIGTLHREGVRIVMLTGDSRTTAQAVARKLSIDDVIAEVLPDQKVWYSLLGWKGDPHWNPIRLASNAFIFGGFLLLAAAWRVLFAAQREGRLAKTGPYRHIRHPSTPVSSSS